MSERLTDKQLLESGIGRLGGKAIIANKSKKDKKRDKIISKILGFDKDGAFRYDEPILTSKGSVLEFSVCSRDDKEDSQKVVKKGEGKNNQKGLIDRYGRTQVTNFDQIMNEDQIV